MTDLPPFPVKHPNHITLGMGATLISGTDRNPATVVDIFTSRKRTIVAVQRDSYQAAPGAGGMGHQSWETSRNLSGEIRYYRWSPHLSRWDPVEINSRRSWVLRRWSGVPIVFGERNVYHDWEF